MDFLIVQFKYLKVFKQLRINSKLRRKKIARTKKKVFGSKCKFEYGNTSYLIFSSNIFFGSAQYVDDGS